MVGPGRMIKGLGSSFTRKSPELVLVRVRRPVNSARGDFRRRSGLGGTLPRPRVEDLEGP